MSRNGTWGGLSNRNFKQSLSYLPDPKQLHTIDFPLLNGGLNLYDLDYRLNPNESPDMKNLRWRDGALGSRYGQVWLIEPVVDAETQQPTEVGYAAYDDLFWGYAFVHVDNELRCFDPTDDEPEYFTLGNWVEDLPDNPGEYVLDPIDVPENRGTFFRYGDFLMYKNKGGYFKIEYNSIGADPASIFPVHTVADEEFVPVTYINMNPTTMAGTEYQPENRMSYQKTLWYTAESGITKYWIPYGNERNHVYSVGDIVVDGVKLTSGYTVHINESGTEYEGKACVEFDTAPPVQTPVVANTVRITYTTSGADADNAYNSVMDCPYATVYGGDQNLCVVLGGCPAQPNAYFWSGNDDLSMNPFYFPMPQYNFAGDTESGIVGFGKQQGFLVVLSKKGVGRAKFGTTTAGTDRLLIEMPYTAINSKIGCDFPWSIQLVDNNIVFCNEEHGVCLIADSSAAYENNIVELGKKINGNEARRGMMYDTFVAGENGVYSTVYEDKYWLVANGNAYVWDFRLSNYKNPTWFLYTSIRGVAYIKHVDDLYHLSADGGASAFLRDHYADYGGPIEKVYQFATQMMGTYERLKNVVKVIFVIRSDTDTITQVQYITDYEKRYDLTPLVSMSWHLSPRNLNHRFLSIQRFASVQKRNPMCRHVRHFTMRLENNTAGDDLSVVSAQVFYNFQGRQM